MAISGYDSIVIVDQKFIKNLQIVRAVGTH